MSLAFDWRHLVWLGEDYYSAVVTMNGNNASASYYPSRKQMNIIKIENNNLDGGSTGVNSLEDAESDLLARGYRPGKRASSFNWEVREDTARRVLYICRAKHNHTEVKVFYDPKNREAKIPANDFRFKDHNIFGLYDVEQLLQTWGYAPVEVTEANKTTSKQISVTDDTKLDKTSLGAGRSTATKTTDIEEVDFSPDCERLLAVVEMFERRGYSQAYAYNYAVDSFRTVSEETKELARNYLHLPKTLR